MRVPLSPLIIAPLALTAALGGCAPGPTYPTVESCTALPPFENYRGPDAVAVSLRVADTMGPDFDAVGICIAVDGRVIRPEAPAAVAAGFAAHAPLDVQPLIAPGVSHRVLVVATFRGRRAVEGYRFSVQSSREISAADLHPGELHAEFVEGGGAEVPTERRPTIVWTGLRTGVVPPN